MKDGGSPESADTGGGGQRLVESGASAPVSLARSSTDQSSGDSGPKECPRTARQQLAVLAVSKLDRWAVVLLHYEGSFEDKILPVELFCGL